MSETANDDRRGHHVTDDLAVLRDMKYLTPRKPAAVKGVEAELARHTRERGEARRESD